MAAAGEMVRDTVTFEDRRAAGRLLAVHVDERGFRPSVVIGVALGGVPVAYEVARALGARLDVVVVRKVRGPGRSAQTLGAACAEGEWVIREGLYQAAAFIGDDCPSRLQAAVEEARGLELRLRAEHPPTDLRDRTVLVVDDGIATGVTMEAAVQGARQRGAAVVGVAAPFCTRTERKDLRRCVDEMMVLSTPGFWEVGDGYRAFQPVTEEEVLDLLRSGRMVAP